MGAWLTGLQDNDKLAARAAQAAFQKVFPTDDKQKAVWRVYQRSILEYCREAILRENVRTLSDERTTSPDDAEAKYARVVSSALLTVTSLLGRSYDCAISNKPDAENVRYPLYKRATT